MRERESETKSSFFCLFFFYIYLLNSNEQKFMIVKHPHRPMNISLTFPDLSAFLSRFRLSPAVNVNYKREIGILLKCVNKKQKIFKHFFYFTSVRPICTLNIYCTIYIYMYVYFRVHLKVC